jgi:hypothetical protein
MAAGIAMEEYLAEIRDQVCSCCVERPPGGPPCAPLGKVCGVEMHLPKLVEAIHEIDSPWIQHYLEHNRETICENCAFYHASCCPCPMDELIFLVVKAVNAVDQRHAEDSGAEAAESGEATPEPNPPSLEEIVRLYRDTAAQWTGCDWPTSFGRGRIDLSGVRAMEADAKAAAGEAAASDWREASRWLARVERYACEAQREAAHAIAAARVGAWQIAAYHAERAWALEFATGRPLWGRPSHTWHRFNQAVQSASRAAVLVPPCGKEEHPCPTSSC